MGTLLPDRHPNKDFFVLDVQDSTAKDDMASMEHPIYSLSVKPDMRELEYDYKDHKMKIVPSGRGLATIVDKDIILYAISKQIHEMNQGREITDWVEFTAHEVMVATNKNTSARDYQRLEDSLVRLLGTQVITNIKSGGYEPDKGFTLINAWEIDRRDENGKVGLFGRMSKVRIQLSQWTMAAIEAQQVLTINARYFRLRKPMERRLYELARKHVGNQAKWEISLPNLQLKVGSKSPLKRFRFAIKEIIRDGNIPDYDFGLEGSKVVVRRKKPLTKAAPKVTVREDTIERAREMAIDKGYDFNGLMKEWEGMIAANGPPENADGALIGFIKQKKRLRQASLF
ncbi:MAG: replication initiator protein A [Pseudomonadota bacterium]